jgi:hypothetical protein
MGARVWQVDALAAPITDAFVSSLEPDVVEPSEPFVDDHQSSPTTISDES